jgi:hypothetical protein
MTLREKLKELGKVRLAVGVQKTEGTNAIGEKVKADNDLLIIARVHEYGATIKVTPKSRAFLHRNGLHLKLTTKFIRIPARSFVRKGFAEGRADLNLEINAAKLAYLNGKISLEQLKFGIGKQLVMEIAGNIGQGVAPITKYTRDHRKESKFGAPLHDTEKLYRHITWSDRSE